MIFLAITLDATGEKGYTLLWVSDDGAVWTIRPQTTDKLLVKVKELLDKSEE